jgi:putative protease
MTKRVELLAPAGDLNRGIIALDFGADAIYFGAQQYSLRARASNFTPDNIREISEYAHSKNKHIYLVANILCHEPMLPGFKPFLDNVMKYKPDAFISSDPFIISSIHKNYPEAQIHVSTQQSITNSKGALFFKKNGATRVILSREVSYDELKQMTKALNGAIEVETFVHGAVCIAYSGRCMLSNNFCFRDANIGGCAQSCR